MARLANRRSPADAWIEKVVAAFESAERFKDAENEQDVRLAIHVLNQSCLQASAISEFGSEQWVIDVRIDEPECFACGKDTTERGGKLLYCSDECQELAGSVRYVRKKIDEKANWNLELLVGVGQRLYPWITSGKAYGKRDRHVPDVVRVAVFERDGHKCVLCGAPATEIDHIAGSSAERSNLQALCSQCNREKMLGGLVPTDDESQKEATRDRITYFAELLAAPEPPTLGFDHRTWQGSWARYAADRKLTTSVS